MPDPAPGSDSNSPERENLRESQRLHDLAMQTAVGMVKAISQNDEAAMRELINTIYFMLSISRAFGGKVLPVDTGSEGANACDQADACDGDCGCDKPQHALVMVDAVTEEPIDSNTIIDRVNGVLDMVRRAAAKAREERGEPESDDLTEEDL